MKQSSIQTLIDAMRILARNIESDDGIANAAIAEAADRLEFHVQVIDTQIQLRDDHCARADKCEEQRDELLEALELTLEGNEDAHWFDKIYGIIAKIKAEEAI